MTIGELKRCLFRSASLGAMAVLLACSQNASTEKASTPTPGGGGGTSSITVSVSPDSADLTLSASQPITATLFGSTNTEVIWYVDNVAGGNDSVGTILGTGNSVSYKAPATAGTHIVVAASKADLTRRGAGTMRVTGQVAVAVTPSTATLSLGGAQSFTASVTGSTNTAVTWSVDDIAGGNATVGLLSGIGSTIVYTAPNTAGTHTLMATSTADATKHASATLTIQSAPAPVSVSISPSTFTLGAGGSQLLTANVAGTANTAVTWAVDGTTNGSDTVGKISGTGNSVTYLAPSAGGTHTVVATSVADTSKSGSASANITSGCTPAPANTQVITVTDAAYGAKGNGVANDTAALQKAVDAMAGKGGTVRVPAGTYMVDALTSVYLKSNMTLSMDSGATLKAIPNSATNYGVLRISGVSNVNVVGGTIQGERAYHTGTGGEWGHGIVVSNNSQHVVIEGLVARDCWGDGVDIAGATDVTLCSVTADNNRRQGMSITSVNGMVVRNCTFKNTHGTLPEDGLDIEPNSGDTVNNVLITGCTFSGNSGFGLEVGVPISLTGKAWVTAIVVDGNTANGNGYNSLNTGGRAGIEASN